MGDNPEEKVGLTSLGIDNGMCDEKGVNEAEGRDCIPDTRSRP